MAQLIESAYDAQLWFTGVNNNPDIWRVANESGLVVNYTTCEDAIDVPCMITEGGTFYGKEAIMGALATQ